MPIVTKVLQDGAGNKFNAQFWDDGSGNLQPAPYIGATATDASVQAVKTTLGSPLQAGGNVVVTGSALPTGAATDNSVKAITTALGSPLQAGGNVVITSSALPSGAAKDSTVASITTALGSPLQAGGNVVVTGIPLPPGAATDNSVKAITTALGSPLQTGGNVAVTSSALPQGAALDTSVQAVKTALGTPLQTGGTVVATLPQVAATDRGGVFGTTSTQLMPANANRKFIAIQVQGTTGGVYINGGGTAATTDYHSLYIPAGGYFESSSHVSTNIINIICTAANVSVYAREG